mmetsp:Transcript_38339/g.77349  ORF Transcript_38339/g.77349 Transcript_38339/m.77349 type:complete len:221 (+) Transcript_38339:73-735(+)|eukprot:CAMPEP_0171600666 /NCGR_PEP_ID=MMETSP0990-20121206/4463_1 /TAXON_ID=483369 /ORGANISM="non described non described, Strain CCMP2098" /LENGTH=220 /DNA_ID=CAMNT_0012162675 /DNA_START=52 /DNA_END=714 /DNA_ORIENTATION=+
MALSRIDFWNDFFFQRPTPADASLKSEAHEWYISAKDTHDIVLRKLKGRHRASTKILHNGCGSSELGVILAEEFLQVIDCDASQNVVSQMSLRFPTHTFVVVDARALPLKDSSIDVIICKGMFDSITADSSTRAQFAKRVVSEAARVLRPGGEYLIFSTFGLDDTSKNMQALLQHSCLSMEVEHLLVPPLEIPDQPGSFVYCLRRLGSSPAKAEEEGNGN